MPRSQEQRDLLHEATFEGVEYWVCFITTEVMLTRDSNSGPGQKDKIIDLVDDDNKTSLCRAQEGGRMDIYKILLDG